MPTATKEVKKPLYENVKNGEAFVVASRFGAESIYFVIHVTPKQFTMKQHRGSAEYTYWKEKGHMVGGSFNGASIVRPATREDIKNYDDAQNAKKEKDAAQTERFNAIKQRQEDLVAPLASGPFTCHAQFDTNPQTAGQDWAITFYGLSEETAKKLVSLLTAGGK